MNAEAIAALGKIIVDGALEMAANKVGVTVGEIAAVVAADPRGNCARYVADLIATGYRNIDTIIYAAAVGATINMEALA